MYETNNQPSVKPFRGMEFNSFFNKNVYCPGLTGVPGETAHSEG